MHTIHARYRRIFYPRDFMQSIKIDPYEINLPQQKCYWYVTSSKQKYKIAYCNYK